MTPCRKILLFALLLLPVLVAAAISFLQLQAGSAVKYPAFNSAGSIIVFYTIMVLSVAFFTILFISEIERSKKRSNKLDTNAELLDNTQILMRNSNNEIISWNRGMENLFGWTKEEALGKNCQQLLNTQFQQPYEEIEKVLFSTHQWQGELTKRKKDGTILNISSHWSLTHGSKGQPFAIIESDNDITELKKAEERVAFLSGQINQSNDAIFVVDKNRLITSWNRGAEKIYGFSESEALGKEINTLLQTAMTSTEIDIAVNQLSAKGYWAGDLKRKKKDGTEVFVYSSTSTIKDAGDSITGYVGVSLDITEKVKLREQVDWLATHVNQSSDSVFSIDMHGKILSWNRGAEEMHGFSRQEAIGKTAKELGLIDLPDEEIAAVLAQVIQEGSWQAETSIYRRNGTSFFGALNANRVKLPSRDAYAIAFIVKDISERKKLEERLREYNTALEEKITERTQEMASSERRFRAIIENNYDSIVLMDQSFKTIYRSPASSRLTGWTDEEMDLPEATKNIHPDDTEKLTAAIFEAVAYPDKPVRILYRFRHKKNYYIWVEANIINRLQDDAVKALVFNSRDVTERIHAEEKLAFSEKHFRALLENNYDVISLMNASFRIFYRSPSAARITGWTDEDMLDDDGKKNIHPDDREMAAAVVNEIMIHPGKPVNTIFRNRHKQGHYIWVEGIVINRLQDENVRAIVFNYRDVTERKEAEEKLVSSEKRFRLLIENSAEGVSLLDRHSNVIYRSPAGYKILGNRDVKNSIYFAHPDYLDAFKNKFAASLAAPGVAVHYESRYARASGEYFWTEGSFTNLLDVQGVNAVVANYRDVTKRKELEDLLKKAYALANIGGWEVDLKKGTVYWTDITRGIHETAVDFVPDLASGLHFYKEGETRDIITRRVDEAIAVGTPWDLELQIVTAKNNTRWVRSIGQAEFVDGKCIRIYGSFQDINERRQAQEQLKASENRLRSLIENISDGIVLTDKDSNILYQSPSVTKIIGYSLEERKGKNLLDFVHPHDQNDLMAFNHRLGETRDTPLPFQFRFRHKKGHYIWLEGFVRNLLHDPAVKASVSNYRDITERKESEEALQKSEKLFRSLFENLRNGFAYYKAVFKKEKLVDAVYLAANTEYESLVGITQLTGKKVVDVLPGLLNREQPYAAIIEKVLQTGEPERFETFMQPIQKWLSVAMYSPAKGYFVVLTDDITERKMVEQKINNINVQLEERVIKRTEELKKVNEELEAFSYSVSHDLRAPLRGIIGFTAILEEEYAKQLDDEARRITGIIKHNTLKMGNLIDDLLFFSRMGRHQIELAEIDTNEMVQTIITELDSSIHKYSQNAVDWVIGSLHFSYGDISAIRQVWTNLLSNAVKYSGARPKPKVEIQSYLKEDQLVFMIKDNGAGFDQKYSHKLFKVFQRLHAADEFEGTGVGLAIVDKIISKHGGKVWAEGVVGEGAAFYFSLPAGKTQTNNSA